MAKTDITTANGTFDGLNAQIDITTPIVADDDFELDIAISQAGIEPDINVVFAIDTSGSTSNDTELVLPPNDPNDPNAPTADFLEAQIFAIERQLEGLLALDNDPADITVTLISFNTDVDGPNDDPPGRITVTLEDTTEIQEFLDGLSSNGFTNFEDALDSVEEALDDIPGSENDTNILYFYSDGFPVLPNGQSQDIPAAVSDLEDAYPDLVRFGIGLGDRASETALGQVDSSGDATIVETEAEILALIDLPPPLPEIDTVDIFVDGLLIDTVPITDFNVTGAGFTLNDIDVSGYPVVDNQPLTVDVKAVINFSNGETLEVEAPVKIIDGIVEGTAGGDVINVDYTGDPEGDRVDNDDNIGGTPEECNDDTIDAAEGDDTINAALGDDLITGGEGDDTFIEVAGEGSDTITDFGEDDSGSINDGDQTNNDFVDLSGFYNPTTLEQVNNSDSDPTNDFGLPIGLLRADAEDGKIDGVIDGVDFSDIIGDVDITLLDGNGNAVTGTDLTFDNTNVACFVRGTQIATRRGSVAIEDLKVGDEIITMDHGFQKIRWIGSTSVPATGDLAPIVIRKGAMGNDRDLRVSPQHRMLVRGWHVELMFDQKEALVPAKALINDETVFPLEGGTVDYFHMMFDRHELVYAEGIPSESFHPGHVGLGSFAEDTREEILQLFPELREGVGEYSEHVRPSLKVREAKVLAENPELMQE